MTSKELILAICESMIRISEKQDRDGDEAAKRMLRRCQLMWNRARPLNLQNQN